MFTLVIGFMTLVLELSALAITLFGLVAGSEFADQQQLEGFVYWLCVGGGGLAGLAVGSVILGVPILMIRINQNLEKVHSAVNGLAFDVRNPSEEAAVLNEQTL